MFEEYMDNDLNTQNVLTLANDILKKINVSVRANDLNSGLTEANTLKTIFDVLGVKLSNVELTSEDIDNYNKWQEYKAQKDFENADKYRALLLNRGII